MSPSRAQSDPVGEQQQHHRRLTSTVLKLTVLSRGSNLQGYAEAVEWVNNLSEVCCKLTEDQARFDPYSQLLASLYSAISNGLKQLLMNWPDELCGSQHSVFRSAVRSVDGLCFNLRFIEFSPWYKKNAHKACGMAVKTGFLEQLSPFMSHLLLLLQPLQQATAVSEQQYTDTYDKIVCLATSLLGIWCSLLQSWPGCKLPDSIFATAHEPATSLALTLMLATSAQLQHADISDNSNSSDNSDSHSSKGSVNSRMSAPDLWRSSCKAGFRISIQLMRATYDECCTDRKSSSNSSRISHAAAAMSSADGQRLLLFGLAALAAKLHQQYSSRPATVQVTAADTPNAQAQPAGPQHGHLQLLIGLGFSTTSIAVLDAELGDLARDALYCVEPLDDPQTHQKAIKVLEHLYESSFSQWQLLNGASSATGSGHPGGIAASDLLQQLAHPVLHTLKDLVLLLPDSSVADSITMLRSFSYILLLQLQSNGLQQRQQVWQWLLHPIFVKVCGAAKKGCQHQQQNDSRSGSPAAEVDAQIVQTWVAATSAAFAFGAPSGTSLVECVKGIMMQQPVTTLMAVEAVTRSAAESELQLVSAKVPLTMSMACVSSEPSDANGILAQPQLQQQLASFVCSHLKLLLIISTAQELDGAGEDQRMSSISILHQGRLITGMMQAYKPAQQDDAGQTAQQVADNTSGQQQFGTGWPVSNWMAVLGRAMYASAVCLLQQVAINANPTPRFCQMTTAVISGWLEYVRVAYEVLGDSTGTDAALLEVKHQLQDCQLALASAHAALADNTLQDKRKQQLLLQLQHCGAAICAALPVKFCCNNPACVNLAKLSEQQLVAGRGSRCSGCKVARYCSRDCQLKHWKQHKKMCKRIQQAEVAGGRSSSAS